MTEQTDILLQEKSPQGVLRLTLNDVRKRNALSEAMLSALAVALDSAAKDPSVRVIILASNGPAFSAGHDLKEMTAGRQSEDKGLAYFSSVMDQCCGVMQAIVNNPKPVIAEVSGVAAAAGCQLVASCDLAYAADTAGFMTPGVNIGLFCSTPMVALSRNLSHKFAMEMLLTGDMTTAERAAQIGLINKAVPADELRQYTLEVAEKIASKSTMTVATGKTAFYAQSEMPLSKAYEYTARVMVDNLLKQDAKEGIGAFIEKRKPDWTDS